MIDSTILLLVPSAALSHLPPYVWGILTMAFWTLVAMAIGAACALFDNWSAARARRKRWPR